MKDAFLLFLVLVFSLSRVLHAQENPAGSDRAKAQFHNWDRNDDGVVSKEELPDPLQKNFARVDKDGNGLLSLEEHLAFLAARGKGRQGNGNANPQGVKGLEGVQLTKDVPYAGTENPRQALDLYLPEGHGKDSEPLPVIAFIHGGGWRNGSKDGAGRKVLPFVQEGKFVGVSIGYRLSGEAIWPAQIHDCKAAIRWLKANAKEYGIDPERIGIWGSSAGGHLVAMLGLSGGVEDLEGELGSHLEVDSRVACVVNYYGPSELLTMNDHESKIDHNAPDSPESLLIGGPIQENKEKTNAASPITYVTPDDSPMLVVHGTKDMLVPYAQSVDLVAKMKEADLQVTFHTVEGGGHGQGFGAPEEEAVQAFLEAQLVKPRTAEATAE